MALQTPTRLIIASRESQLAMWQARHICSQIAALYPQIEVSILGMTTRGDQILDKTLAKIGGKGLFVKELETALANDEADLAVHSLKDVPMLLPDGFVLSAIGEREDPRDAFVSLRYGSLAELPPGSVVGTSSLRRQSQICATYPHLVVRPLRGNVQTRLRKLDEGEFDAIILAAAGLIRLGLSERIRAYISVENILPAAGQGALGIEVAAHRPEVAALLAPLHHAPTAACVLAERSLARALGGSCQVPLAAFAQWRQGQIYLRGLVAAADGSRVCRADAQGLDPESLGLAVANTLLSQGAQSLLDLALAS